MISKRTFFVFSIIAYCNNEFLSQASLAVTTYAATSVSFDDYATFLAYDQARNSIDPKSGTTENKDFALADTDAIEDTTTDNIPSVWGLIANVADAKAAGKIDSVKQPVLTKLSATAQRITSSTTQAKFTEQVKAVYAAAGGKIKIHTGTGAYEAGDSNYASKLRTAVGNFNAAQASSAATDVFESIYGAENWHPDTGLATEAMAVIYSVVNVIFTVVAQIIMWFFMAQSAFDLFYISFEPIRPSLVQRVAERVELTTMAAEDFGISFVFRSALMLQLKPQMEAARVAWMVELAQTPVKLLSTT